MCAPALVSRVFAPTMDNLVRSFSYGRSIHDLTRIYPVLDIHGQLIYRTKQSSSRNIHIPSLDIPSTKHTLWRTCVVLWLSFPARGTWNIVTKQKCYHDSKGILDSAAEAHAFCLFSCLLFGLNYRVKCRSGYIS